MHIWDIDTPTCWYMHKEKVSWHALISPSDSFHDPSQLSSLTREYLSGLIQFIHPSTWPAMLSKNNMSQIYEDYHIGYYPCNDLCFYEHLENRRFSRLFKLMGSIIYFGNMEDLKLETKNARLVNLSIHCTSCCWRIDIVSCRLIS